MGAKQPAVCAVMSLPSVPLNEHPPTPSKSSSIAPDDHFEDLQGDVVDPVYRAKARLLNQAIRDIGIGKYQVRLYFIATAVNLNRQLRQWFLFVVAGFGWFA